MLPKLFHFANWTMRKQHRATCVGVICLSLSGQPLKVTISLHLRQLTLREQDLVSFLTCITRLLLIYLCNYTITPVVLSHLYYIADLYLHNHLSCSLAGFNYISYFYLIYSITIWIIMLIINIMSYHTCHYFIRRKCSRHHHHHHHRTDQRFVFISLPHLISLVMTESLCSRITQTPLCAGNLSVREINLRNTVDCRCEPVTSSMVN